MTSVRASRLAGLVAATLVAAAGLVGLSTAPAAAALCSSSGINVVVDFNGLGGGVQKGCDPGGAGKSGNKVFPAAGFSLEFVRGSGFVCRVRNQPGGNVCATTPPTNAYWGLFWSDGKSGKWTYATTGVGGTSVPSGGFLAFAWQDSSSRHQPAVTPVNSRPAPTRAPTQKPTKAPTKKPTKAPSKKPIETPGDGTEPTKAPKATKATKTPVSSTTAPTTTAAPAARASATVPPSATPSTSESASASTLVGPATTGGALPDANSAPEVDGASTPEEEPSGLPAWVPITVIVALAGAAGGAVWWRRRTGAA